MSSLEYKYDAAECDVPKTRSKLLAEYRRFRCDSLQYLRGNSETSISNQINDLAWHTAVFRTLNEARRLEPERAVNGALWELTTAGYASLMVLGIRKLVDKHAKSSSIWNIIAKVEKRPELLTREMFVCYDGLPYDYEKVQKQHLESFAYSKKPTVTWRPTSGPNAWETSKRMHEAFDRLAGATTARRRTDTIAAPLFTVLKERLAHPAIGKVWTMADKKFAHAERRSEDAIDVPIATYNEVDEALKQIVQVTNFLSSVLFYNTAIGSVVPIPQFDPLKDLDTSWVKTENMQALHDHWIQLCAAMDGWADVDYEEFDT